MRHVVFSLLLAGCVAGAANHDVASISPYVLGCYVDSYLYLYPCEGATDATSPIYKDNPSGAVRSAAGACPAYPCALNESCDVWASWKVGWKPGVCRLADRPAGWIPGDIISVTLDVGQ